MKSIPKRDADNNPRDPQTLTRFIDAVQKDCARCSGTPVSIAQIGTHDLSAFVHAGIYGMVSIGLLSLPFCGARRDVVLMLAAVGGRGDSDSGNITLIRLPLNYANIIALPLLLVWAFPMRSTLFSTAQNGAAES